MEEKETTATASINALLDSILQSKHGHRGKSIKIFASPEEGAHLIRAFVRIKQPELRAAIIKIATQFADDGALTKPVQNQTVEELQTRNDISVFFREILDLLWVRGL
jgi:hypothetical protein